MKAPRYSPAFLRDWAFFTRGDVIAGSSRFVAKGAFKDSYDPEGVDAKHAFWVYDSQGVVMKNTDPDSVCSAIAAKGLGMQVTIENWAEDCVAGLLNVAEVREWSQSMPGWVFSNFIKTAQRTAERQIGFIPTFLLTA